MRRREPISDSIVDEVAIWRNLEGVQPKDLIRAPKMNLSDGEQRQSSYHCDRHDLPPDRLHLEVVGNFIHPPSRDDEYSNQREIGITVRHPLQSNLDNPNYRDEGAQVPRPAGYEVRPSFALRPDNRGTYG